MHTSGICNKYLAVYHGPGSIFQGVYKWEMPWEKCSVQMGNIPWEMFCAYDPMIIAVSLVELEERYLTWRNNIEGKGLKVNTGHAKIMKCGTNKGPVFAFGKYLYGVCKKRVGRNSVYCSFCKHLVHKRCSGFKGKLIETPGFKCHSCLHLPESDYERVDKLRWWWGRSNLNNPN